jgi:two-component system sensor histidine kinase NblS
MIYYFVNFIFFKKIKFDLKYFNKTKVFVSELSTTLIENFLDGIILLNLDLEVIYINEQALKFLNWKFREICEINLLENFDSEFNKQFLEEIEKLILKINSHEEKKYKEIIISLNKYSEKIILIIIKIIVKKKKIIGTVLIIKNISKKITLNKRKLLFLSNISHELRTPLFNIQSFIQTLERSLNKLKQNEISEFLNITNKEILRLNKLVTTTLNISKLNYQNNYNFSLISVSDLFTQFIQIYSIRLKQKKIKIFTEIEKNLEFILGKKDLLLQVFDNLLGNSLKFSNLNGTIILRAYSISNTNKTKIRIEIGDYGIGIGKNIQINVFRKFSRINYEVIPIYGNGLGLSITKKILDKQGNSIFFTSDYNEGIIFFMDFKIEKHNNNLKDLQI